MGCMDAGFQKSSELYSITQDCVVIYMKSALKKRRNTAWKHYTYRIYSFFFFFFFNSSAIYILLYNYTKNSSDSDP